MDKYRLVKKPGVTVAIMNRGRVLLLRRISLPFMVNPGIWYFVGGGRKGRETPLQNAYREIREETGIEADRLCVTASGKIVIRDQKRKERWSNEFFVMRSADRRIRLNFENRDHKWVEFQSMLKYKGLLGSLENSKGVLAMIKGSPKKS